MKRKLETYCNIKPKGRLQELELFALTLLTGEEIEQQLRAVDKSLAEEYKRLCGWGED